MRFRGAQGLSVAIKMSEQCVAIERVFNTNSQKTKFSG